MAGTKQKTREVRVTPRGRAIAWFPDGRLIQAPQQVELEVPLDSTGKPVLPKWAVLVEPPAKKDKATPPERAD